VKDSQEMGMLFKSGWILSNYRMGMMNSDNLHETRKFLVESMNKALVHSNALVINNEEIWKMDAAT
jgi:hypothetical protein